MKKLLAILLALSMLLSIALVSCTPSNDPGADTSDSVTTKPVETGTPDNVPELNYGNETITFLNRTEDSTKPEFYVEESSGSGVDSAIYARNEAVQARLSVTFEFIDSDITFAGRQSFPQTLKTAINANTRYDVVAGYSMAIANCAVAGYLYDLKQTEYLDFSQPWWPSTLLDTATIKDSLYFCSGDISTWYILYIYCMTFNKDLIEQYQIEDPYDLVATDEWTLQTLFDLTYGIGEDNATNAEGAGKKSNDDTYGFAVPHVYIDALYFLAGLSIIDKDVDGKLQLSDDYSAESETTLNLIDDCVNYFHYTNDGYLVPLDTTGTAVPIFQDGKTVFQISEIQQVYTIYSSTNINYGILPLPKYSYDQEDYSTITSFPYTLYGVPTNTEDPDRVSAVLECLASDGYNRVSPALFEVALKTQYSDDSRDAAMYDIVKRTVVFDLGRIYTDSFNGDTYAMWRNMAIFYKQSWATQCAEKNPSISAMIDALFNG